VRFCSTSSGSGQLGENILINVRPSAFLTDDRDTRAIPSRPARSRSNTAHGYAERFNPVEEEPEPEPARMTIPKLSSQRSRSPGPEQSPGGYSLRPSLSRTSTYENSNGYRDDSPARRLSRVPTDSSVISSGRTNLRPVRQASASQQNTFADDYEDDYAPSNGNGYRRDRSPPSPDTSSSVGSGRGGVISRAASWSAAGEQATNGKKAPPPPPPSRAKKPPPPPPPMKRSALSESQVARY
jgi:hypothetical protein